MQFRKTCKRYRWLASRRNSNNREPQGFRRKAASIRTELKP